MIRILWGKMAERQEYEEIGRAIRVAGKEIANSILELVNALVPRATKLTLLYSLEGGSAMGSPVTNAVVGQTYNPSVVESNSTTPSIPPIGPLVYASDNTAVVTVDPTTGVATMVEAGTANASVIDQGNSLTDSVAFTVVAATPPVADKLTLNFTLA
jgi:hypothetical protein